MTHNFILKSRLIWYSCHKTNHFLKNLLIKRFFWCIWHFDTIPGYHLTTLWNIFNISIQKWRFPSGTANLKISDKFSSTWPQGVHDIYPGLRKFRIITHLHDISILDRQGIVTIHNLFFKNIFTVLVWNIWLSVVTQSLT